MCYAVLRRRKKRRERLANGEPGAVSQLTGLNLYRKLAHTNSVACARRP